MDGGFHTAAVAAPPIPGRVVIGLDEAVEGFSEVFVDGWEVVNGDSALREKNEALVRYRSRAGRWLVAAFLHRKERRIPT